MNVRTLRTLSAVFTLLLIPALALAEVSVKLDREGRLKKVVYRTKIKKHSATVWGQVRKHVPLEHMLNPLGDNLGDLPPTIARHPETGYPWVVWSANVANQKLIVIASWTGSGWTAPAPIVTVPDPMWRDQLDPFLAFDASGRPYLVWWVDASVAKVYFSTLRGDAWTPPLLLSDPAVDSRHPALALEGADVKLVYETPGGPSLKVLGAMSLVQSANDLMDSPIPPGEIPDDPDAPPGGDDGEDPIFSKN